MLCWEVYNQSKNLSCRPSDLYGVEWPLVRFYFDRAIYRWGGYVERKVSEAESTIRQRMHKQKAANVESFVMSWRISTFNKIMGLSTAAAYAKPVSTQSLTGKPKKASVPSNFGSERMFSG